MDSLQLEVGSAHLLLTMSYLSGATSGKALLCLGLRALVSLATASVCLPFVLPTWSLAGHLLEGVALTGIQTPPVLQDLESRHEEAKQNGMPVRLCPAPLLLSGCRQVVFGSVDDHLGRVVGLASWMRREEEQRQRSVYEAGFGYRIRGSVSRVCKSSMVR